MDQFMEIKHEHPGTILFFRMGDFYELFHEDAEIAAPVLGLALTSRDKNAETSNTNGWLSLACIGGQPQDNVEIGIQGNSRRTRTRT